MSFFDAAGSGTGGFPGGTTFGRTASKGDILGRRYAPFSNPFFDQASTYLPPTVKAMFGFCRFYHLTNGVINAIATKAAEYPVTDIMFQHDDAGVRDKWEELLLGTLNYRVHQFETNLDYYVYGNAFVSLSFPFRKKITCKKCSAKIDALDSRQHWRYTNFQFWLECPKCGQSDYATSSDEYYKQINEISLIRWNPENVTIFHNESTGRLDYALDISPQFRGEIMMGRKDLVATTPEIFLDAARTKRMLVFDKKEVFHMRRPSLSSMQTGWGIPLLMAVMKDAFYLQIMKKAQESILLTHLIPQIFIFPQPATGLADPFTTINLQDWRSMVQRELARQRLDPAYYGIVPFPLGHQTIGENGRQLLLMPEIRAMAEMISIGMGFPIDLVFGQGNYAGTSVSMRMLENFFLSNVTSQYRLLQWVMNRLSAFLGWPMPTARFKPFKMADDLQRQAFLFQLNAAGKISDTTMLNAIDLKVEEESRLQMMETSIRVEALKKQQLAMAEIQGESMLIAAKYQGKAQEMAAEMAPPALGAGADPNAAAAGGAQQQPGAGGTPFEQTQGSGLGGAQPGVALEQLANSIASQLRALPPSIQQQQLQQLAKTQPEIAPMVEDALSKPIDAGIDMRAMPTQRPPRRDGA